MKTPKTNNASGNAVKSEMVNTQMGYWSRLRDQLCADLDRTIGNALEIGTARAQMEASVGQCHGATLRCLGMNRLLKAGLYPQSPLLRLLNHASSSEPKFTQSFL